MSLALKLMMSNRWVKMAEAEDGIDLPGGAEEQGPVVETSEEEEGVGEGDDLDWLLEDEEGGPEPAPKFKEEPAKEEEQEEAEPVEEEEVEGEEPEKKEPPKEEREQEEAPTQMTEEQIAEAKEKFRADLEKEFAISDEDANLLVSEPEKVLPRLASTMVVRATEMAQQMVMQLANNLPAMIQQTQQNFQQETDVKNQFMEMNPVLKMLDAKELDAAVETLAPAIKKRFPNATPQERMDKLGKAIAASYGLKAPKAKAPAAKTPKPVTPAAPARSSTPPAFDNRTPIELEIAELLSSDD